MTRDVIIIGASFAGLAAGMQLARARRDVLVIDAGQPRNRYADASHSFMGQDGKSPFSILSEGRRELERYPSIQFVDTTAILASKKDDVFCIATADGHSHNAARLIVATGVKDTLPDVPGLSDRWGKSVVHCPYCHGYEIGEGQLGILATGPGSVHQAILVSDWGPTTLFTQGVVDLDEEALSQLARRSVKVERSAITALTGTLPGLDAVTLEDGRSVALVALFVAPKTQSASDLAEQLGCAFDEGPTGPVIRVDDLKCTTVPGVYAAGDAASPMWNATMAAAAGVMAGVASHRSLLFE